jgi:hypothetical protein
VIGEFQRLFLHVDIINKYRFKIEARGGRSVVHFVMKYIKDGFIEPAEVMHRKPWGFAQFSVNL